VILAVVKERHAAANVVGREMPAERGDMPATRVGDA